MGLRPSAIIEITKEYRPVEIDLICKVGLRPDASIAGGFHLKEVGIDLICKVGLRQFEC